VDLAIRISDLTAMYTDDGMFPRALICRTYSTPWNWSFHFGGGSGMYQAMLFAVAAGLAVALLIGFETRLASIGSWLMLVSLHNRVPPILDGGDNLLRMLLFWSMFLPLDRAWSLEHWLRSRRGSCERTPDLTPVFSVASAALLLQVALMYLFSAIYKTNGDWLHGRAIAGALAHDFYAKPIGAYLLGFPRFLSAMTIGIFGIEWIAPLLLFWPKHTANIRRILLVILAAMHLSIGVFLTVGLFSLVSLAGLSLFIPSEVWDRSWLARFSPQAGVDVPAVGAARRRVTEQVSQLSAFMQVVCALLLAYVVALNLYGLRASTLRSQFSLHWPPLTIGLGLGQKWNMFETIPSKDGWYVGHAHLRDGSDVDLLRQGAPIDWTRPPQPTEMYSNHRWSKCFREMAYEDEMGYQVFRVPVADYLCREWNARHAADRQVETFDLVYCSEPPPSNADAASANVVRERFVHFDFRKS
jgi:hypothetical protein